MSKEVLSQRTGDYQQLGRGLRPQSQDPDRVGREGGAQGRLRPAVVCAAWSRRNAYGVYFIFKSMEQGPTFRDQRAQIPDPGPEPPHSGATSAAASRTTTSTSAMRSWGRWSLRVASFFPFQTTYYLNGHSFIEQELKRAQIGFRKNDNAFLAVDDVGGAAGGRRPAQPGDHPRAARLLDADSGAEVLQARSAAR